MKFLKLENGMILHKVVKNLYKILNRDAYYILQEDGKTVQNKDSKKILNVINQKDDFIAILTRNDLVHKISTGENRIVQSVFQVVRKGNSHFEAITALEKSDEWDFKNPQDYIIFTEVQLKSFRRQYNEKS